VKTLPEKAFSALATVPPAGPKFVARVKLLLQVSISLKLFHSVWYDNFAA
jgi:hypothetical protein